MDNKLCKCGKPVYYNRINLCVNCYNKEYYKTHPECKKQHKKYNKKYRKRPEVKKRLNERNKKRYHSDEKFRQERQKAIKKYRIKCQKENKKGRPEVIKEICKEFGFSEEVSNAIALDGIILDNEMKKRGII